MSCSDSVWSELKIKGNSLYASCKYADAITKYDEAIYLLDEKAAQEPLEQHVRLELAKIYSNRSAARYKLNSDKPGKVPCIFN